MLTKVTSSTSCGCLISNKCLYQFYYSICFYSESYSCPEVHSWSRMFSQLVMTHPFRTFRSVFVFLLFISKSIHHVKGLFQGFFIFSFVCESLSLFLCRHHGSELRNPRSEFDGLNIFIDETEIGCPINNSDEKRIHFEFSAL